MIVLLIRLINHTQIRCDKRGRPLGHLSINNDSHGNPHGAPYVWQQSLHYRGNI